MGFICWVVLTYSFWLFGVCSLSLTLIPFPRERGQNHEVSYIFYGLSFFSGRPPTPPPFGNIFNLLLLPPSFPLSFLSYNHSSN